MKVRKQTITELIKDLKEEGESNQKIEDAFKNCLKAKLIDIDDWSYAMERIYGEEE